MKLSVFTYNSSQAGLETVRKIAQMLQPIGDWDMKDLFIYDTSLIYPAGEEQVSICFGDRAYREITSLLKGYDSHSILEVVQFPQVSKLQGATSRKADREKTYQLIQELNKKLEKGYPSPVKLDTRLAKEDLPELTIEELKLLGSQLTEMGRSDWIFTDQKGRQVCVIIEEREERIPADIYVHYSELMFIYLAMKTLNVDEVDLVTTDR